MKKKLVTMGMMVALCLMFAACSKTEAPAAPTTAPTATEAPTATPEPTETPVPTATPAPTETPAVEDTYVKGIITEEGFESEWMDLRFTKPATVVMATQEEMDAVMMQGLQTMYGENAEGMLDYAVMTTVTEMQATWLAGSPVVQVVVEKMPTAGWTAEAYLVTMMTNVIATYETSGLAYTIEEDIYTLDFAGQEYTGLTVSVDAGTGTPIYQDYLVREKDGRMIMIAFTYIEAMEYYLQEAIASFSAY